MCKVRVPNFWLGCDARSVVQPALGCAQNIVRQLSIIYSAGEHERSDQRRNGCQRLVITLSLLQATIHVAAQSPDRAPKSGCEPLSHTVALAWHLTDQCCERTAVAGLVAVFGRKVVRDVLAKRSSASSRSTAGGNCVFQGFFDKPFLGAELAVEAAMSHSGRFRQRINARP